MALDVIIRGHSTGAGVEVNAANQIKVVSETDAYTNPGEFIQLCTRHIGTVGTSGTVVHRVTPVYGWE